jgi:hypothetical protein
VKISVIFSNEDPTEPQSPAKPQIQDSRAKELIEVPQLPNADSVGDLIAATGVAELSNEMLCESVKRGAGNSATKVFELGLALSGFTLTDLPGFVFSYQLTEEEGLKPRYQYEPRIIGVQRTVNIDAMLSMISAMSRSLVAQRNAVGEQLVATRRIAQAEKQSLIQENRSLQRDISMFRDMANKNGLLCAAANARLNVVTAGFDTLSHAMRLYAGEGSWQNLEGEQVNRVLIGDKNGYELAQHTLNDIVVKELLQDA